MEKLVSLCKRRGFMFQSSEIYGGLNGFWDYGPLGVELKRNVKEAWWRDMVTAHDDLGTLHGAPGPYEMTGLDCTIIMHPQVWKCSGHYDLFHDYMVDCRQSKKRYRYDQIRGRWVEAKGQLIFVTTMAEAEHEAIELERRAMKLFNLRSKNKDDLLWCSEIISLDEAMKQPPASVDKVYQNIEDPADILTDLTGSALPFVLGPDAKDLGTLTEPREFNLMFKTYVGALSGE
ncbi:MAG: hypothetical protein WD030_06485, partial [Pirellulales bacterium]